jgi:preprotein translocase subunit SecA
MPTNVPDGARRPDDEVFRTIGEKYAAINRVDQGLRRSAASLSWSAPCLIEKSEQVSEALKKANIPHEVLNARHHERKPISWRRPAYPAP